MPIETSLSFRGLNTTPNNLGAGAEGALVEADNVVIRFPDVLEPRRGQEAATMTLPVTAPFVMEALYSSSANYYSIQTSKNLTVVVGQQLRVSVGDAGDPFEVTVAGPIQTDSNYLYFRVNGARWPADAGRTNPVFVSYYNRVFQITSVSQFPVSHIAFFQGKTLLHSDLAEKIGFSDASAFLSGDYQAAKPDGFPAYRLKTAVDGRHLQMATNQGVVVVESADTITPRVSGIQAPTLPNMTLLPDVGTPPIPGWLAPGKSVAYRAVFGFKDDNDIVHLGPPSEPVSITNTTSVNANVNIKVPLGTAPVLVGEDNELVKGLFVQLYRSPVVTSPTQPLDLLQLATEVNVSPDLVYLDSAIITDIAPPAFVLEQRHLYTNEEQEGATQANDPAPYATDLASWNQRLWYANTRQPDFLSMQLLGIFGGGMESLQATGLRFGDTLTVVSGTSSITYTAAPSTNVSLNQFVAYVVGTPQENVEKTLIGLAQCVNYALVDDIVAYLTEGAFGVRSTIVFKRRTVDEASSTGFTVLYATAVKSATVVNSSGTTYRLTIPGPVTGSMYGFVTGDWVELRNNAGTSLGTFVLTSLSGTEFTFTSANANVLTAATARRAFPDTVWNPDLSVGQTSENDRAPERLYYSKVREPEAVPALNYIDVGTAGKAILRIQPQRDRLLVFKEEGTFAIYGDYPFSASLVDDTVQLIAPDSVTAIGSTVFALMDDGVNAITEGAIQPIDEPIDSLLKPYFASANLAATATAFGVGYESEKVFALFMPNLVGVSGYGAKAYVYGLNSGAWTTWSFPQARTCGKVSPSLDAGFYGLAATPYLVKDRKTSSTEDYRQEDSTAITSTIRWAPTTLGSPYATKQVREAHFHFREVKKPAGQTVTAQFSLKTDIVPGGGTMDAWSSDDSTLSTGTVIGPAELPLQFRKLVPQPVQRATYYTLGLSATANRSYWALNGYSLIFDSTSERTGTVR